LLSERTKRHAPSTKFAESLAREEAGRGNTTGLYLSAHPTSHSSLVWNKYVSACGQHAGSETGEKSTFKNWTLLPGNRPGCTGPIEILRWSNYKPSLLGSIVSN
jgi:hypothetical protein